MPVNLRFMPFAYFTSEALDSFCSLIDQGLGAGNFLFEALRVYLSLLFQRQQSDVDSQQGLGDFILKIAADLFSFILLRRQDSMGQMPQMTLQAA